MFIVQDRPLGGGIFQRDLLHTLGSPHMQYYDSAEDRLAYARFNDVARNMNRNRDTAPAGGREGEERSRTPWLGHHRLPRPFFQETGVKTLA